MFTFLKNWTLPSAITAGTLLYLIFAYVPELDDASAALGPLMESLLPVSIFLTLFVTFSKVDFHLMRLCRWHLCILAAQLIFISILVWLTLHSSLFILHSSFFTLPSTTEGVGSGYSKLLLEAVLICVIAPCASASPVVTAKLGGDLTQMTTFVLLSSGIASLLIPAVFPLIEPHQGITFLSAFLVILQKLAIVLLLPLALGAIVRHWIKPLYLWFVRTPDLGFYLWSVSLAITSGITVKNIVHSEASLLLLIIIALLTLITSFVQFRIGRLVGHLFGERICTGQAMFQKNTGLAIWIAYVYLTPIASIGAGCYVLWQNLINSYELWQHRRTDAAIPCTTATTTTAQTHKLP